MPPLLQIKEKSSLIFRYQIGRSTFPKPGIVFKAGKGEQDDRLCRHFGFYYLIPKYWLRVRKVYRHKR